VCLGVVEEGAGESGAVGLMDDELALLLHLRKSAANKYVGGEGGFVFFRGVVDVGGGVHLLAVVGGIDAGESALDALVYERDFLIIRHDDPVSDALKQVIEAVQVLVDNGSIGWYLFVFLFGHEDSSNVRLVHVGQESHHAAEDHKLGNVEDPIDYTIPFSSTNRQGKARQDYRDSDDCGHQVCHSCRDPVVAVDHPNHEARVHYEERPTRFSRALYDATNVNSFGL
jgi:hypothetical protein